MFNPSLFKAIESILAKEYPVKFFISEKKGKEREERKGNIFNEFQTNGSILFQHFVKKKKKNLSREITPASPSPGESFFTLIRVAGSTPSKGAGDTEGSFKILLLPGGIPDKSSH